MKSTSPVRKSVWGVVRSKVAWAVVHVLSKRRNAGLSLDDVVVIELTISRSAVRRYNRGVWYTKEHVGRLPVSEAMLLQPSQFGKVGA
jgi:hypothetical protein